MEEYQIVTLMVTGSSPVIYQYKFKQKINYMAKLTRSN